MSSSTRHQVRHGHPTFSRSRSEGVGALIGGSPRRTPRRTNSSINNNSSSASDKGGLKWVIVALLLNIIGVYCISYVFSGSSITWNKTSILTPDVKVWLEENDLKQPEEYFQSLGKFPLLFSFFSF